MEVTFNGRSVTVKQLTVAQVAACLDAPPEVATTADLLVDMDIRESVVRACTGLTTEELNGDVLPSDLVVLWGKVKQANPSLSDLVTRLNQAGKEALDLLSRGQPSEDAPVPSPVSTATPG